MTYYGIYKITNLLNGKMYIGQHTTSNIDDGYMGSGKIILQALKKYGKENFHKEWLMFCEDEEELNYMERVYVDQTWVVRSDTYNLNIGGYNGIRGTMPWNKGRHHSKQTRMKISNKLKNHKVADSSRQKMSEKKKGIKKSEDWKNKHAEAIKLWWSKRKRVDSCVNGQCRK